MLTADPPVLIASSLISKGIAFISPAKVIVYVNYAVIFNSRTIKASAAQGCISTEAIRPKDSAGNMYTSAPWDWSIGLHP